MKTSEAWKENQLRIDSQGWIGSAPPRTLVFPRALCAPTSFLARAVTCTSMNIAKINQEFLVGDVLDAAMIIVIYRTLGRSHRIATHGRDVDPMSIPSRSV